LPNVITYTWVDGTSGDWGTAADWSGGVVANGTANATIAGTATDTVTVSSNQAVNLLTLNDANATLAVTNGATLSAFGGVSDLAVKQIDIAGLTNGQAKECVDRPCDFRHVGLHRTAAYIVGVDAPEQPSRVSPADDSRPIPDPMSASHLTAQASALGQTSISRGE
jgi:hypothetical protein